MSHFFSFEKAGYKNIYAYRFDWDDQEEFFADFPNMIGAAHGLGNSLSYYRL